MSSFTDYLEEKVLDYVFGQVAYTPPTGVHFALSTTTPDETGGNFTEPTGASYARVSHDNDKTTWTSGLAQVSESGHVENAIAITFPEATESWGTVTYVGIYDDVSGGNLMAYGALGTSQAISNGNTASFASGALDIYLS